MTTNRETTPPTPNAGEWIEWHGGENPVPGQMINIRQRGYSNEDDQVWEADFQEWDHKDYDPQEWDIIAYRLATPSPAAQDDPAKGLEAVAWRWRANLWGPDDWRLTDEKPDLGGYNCKTTMQALTDHATAERQIDELRSRVAELEGALEPFARWAEFGTSSQYIASDAPDDAYPAAISHKVGAYRKARQALEAGE